MKFERKIRKAQDAADNAELAALTLMNKIVELAAPEYRPAVLNAFVDIDAAADDARSADDDIHESAEVYLLDAANFISETSTEPRKARALLKDYIRQIDFQHAALRYLRALKIFAHDTRF